MPEAGGGGSGEVRIIIKKKKSGHAAHHGGAWKVAYADFVTAMMALFMVLWLLTQADVKLRSQIARYFKDPGILPGGAILSADANQATIRDPSVVEHEVLVVKGKQIRKKNTMDKLAVDPKVEQRQLEKQAQVLQQAVKDLVRKNPNLAGLEKQVLIQVDSQGLVVQLIDRELSEDLLFDVSSAKLKQPLVLLLQKIAEVIAEGDNPVQVSGHTDSLPYHPESQKTNWQLSFERADNARRVLEMSGLASARLAGLMAYADANPLNRADPLAAENRRLSIVAMRLAPPQENEDGQASAQVVLPPDPLPAASAAFGNPAPEPAP